MNDPYITLGVSEDATDEEIKDAYRALVRKYHPDNYQADSPLAEWATKKMKEINEAYDEIRRRRTREGARAEGAGAPASFAEIRRLINASRFGDARRELSRYPRENQPAEWHFLFSIVLMHDGAVNDGLRELDTACEMEPGNIEYQQAKQMFNEQNRGFGGGYYDARGYRGNAGGCTVCDMCVGLMCMDMCCRSC